MTQRECLPVHPDEAQLKDLVRQIAEAVRPLRIILFGSAARGEMGPESDVDLLVVMPEGTHRGHTEERIYVAVRGIRLPFDVIVATPSDLEAYRETPGLIYREAVREGQTVYVA
jgi:predicted nucleotidyltransferase